MLVKTDSLLYKILLVLASPTYMLPPLFWVMRVRVGDDCENWNSVTLRRPK